MLCARASFPQAGWTCSRLHLEQVWDLATLPSLSPAEPGAELGIRAQTDGRGAGVELCQKHCQAGDAQSPGEAGESQLLQPGLVQL